MSIPIPQIPRRERERLMRRQEILQAARAVFARKGFKDATLDDVAERAEFGKGTLYNYFPNKEALFLSVIEDTFETMKAIAERAFSSDAPFTEQAEQFLRDELTFFFSDLESVQLVTREAHHLRGGNPLMQLMPQLLAVVAERITAEQRRRRVMNNADPRDLAMLLLNMLFGQFSSRIYRRFGTCLHEQVTQSERELTVIDLFKDVSAEEIEREIAAATKLIHTVYFHGICK